MRKRLVEPDGPKASKQADSEWLAVEDLAAVEITSEEPAYPAESVFADGGLGWRAASPGPQTIRIVFDSPQRLRRIWLQFEEPDTERTQEFTLRYAAGGGTPDRELIRQQWHFSPGGSTSETEDYQVDLPEVTALELRIDPDQGRGRAFAALSGWRLA
jgi:hypothetical protein